VQSLEFRRWSPTASPLKIEFPAELAAELWPEPETLETSGVLYGFRNGREVHVLAAEATGDLEQVGIFVARERGEVFLTESNLELFERYKVPVALVRAGGKAGFFVREPNGSIQTVRSHEEFAVDVPALPAPRPMLPLAVRRKPVWAAAGFFALTLPVLAFFRPAPSLGLQVREQAGQLQISWVAGKTALLEIEDGDRHVAAPVFANQSNLTYERSGGEVAVRLTVDDGGAHPQRETARFVVGVTPKR
jgi:hypothetical protein